MNQINLPLFSHFTNDDTPVCQTENKPTHQEKTSDTRVRISDCPTLQQYVKENFAEIWTADNKHREDGRRAVRWFNDYKDFGQLTLDEINRRHIKEFINHLFDTRPRFSNSTANRYIAYLTRPINHAYEEDVTENTVKIKYKKVNSSRPRYFSREEEKAIVNHLVEQGRYWMADMVILSCNSGMRKGEIISINDPKVRLVDGDTLYLPYHVCKTTDRYVPLNQKALDAYKRLTHTIHQYTPQKFTKSWNKMRYDIARGDKHFVFHVCRHTCVSRLVNELGTPQKVVAEILGHSDERTTSNYIHVELQAKKRAVDKL